MIITVTLNPALDKTITVGNLQIAAVNRVLSAREDAGGKGINVSKALASFGTPSVACGLIGGSTGLLIKNCLDAAGIINEFVLTNQPTRTNIKIFDSALSTTTDINEPGLEVSEVYTAQLQDILAKRLDIGDIFVLSGSAPPNINGRYYRSLLEVAKRSGAQTILDVDGALLCEVLPASPDIIKPNIHELATLMNRSLDNDAAVIAAARALINNYSIKLVTVSMGGQGAMFVTAAQAIRAYPPPIDALSSVGAGDTMVAALAIAAQLKIPLHELVPLAVAASAAAVTTPGTQPPAMTLVDELISKVRWNYIE